MSKVNLKRAVKEIGCEEVEKAATFLYSLGVREVADIQLLNENDLEKFFSLVQARKLLKLGNSPGLIMLCILLNIIIY